MVTLQKIIETISRLTIINIRMFYFVLFFVEELTNLAGGKKRLGPKIEPLIHSG